MSEFWKRTVFGALFVIVVLGSIRIHFGAFFVVMAFVVMKGSEEICKLFHHDNEPNTNRAVQSMSLLLYFFLAYFAYFSFPTKYLSLLILFVLTPFLIALLSKTHKFLNIAGVCWASMLFVALPSGLMMLFLDESFIGVNQSKILLIMLFCLIWINDIFAYLTGMAVGRHKLFERISPKKTIEGSMGGLVFTMLTAFLVNHYWLNMMSDGAILGLAAVIVVFGSFGDLCESMLKRQAGVKDSGNVIPGHGGILDRFDATFMAIPFAMTYLLLI